MNSFGITMIVLIAIIIVILISVLIIFLNKKETTIKKTTNTKSMENIPLPTIIGLDLPPKIEKLSKSELHDIVRKVYEAFKIFDYKKMSSFEYEKKEWHSWQISLLLMLYKKDEDLFIPNQSVIFHDSLLNSNQNNIKSLMNSILKKYDNYVEIESTKDMLCKNHIWSNRDVSVILYFLSNYKNYKK